MTDTRVTLENLPEWLTSDEVAELLRLDVVTVRRHCKAGHIKATNLKGKAGYRIHRDDLLRFLKHGDVDPARPRPPRGRKRAK